MKDMLKEIERMEESANKIIESAKKKSVQIETKAHDDAIKITAGIPDKISAVTKQDIAKREIELQKKLKKISVEVGKEKGRIETIAKKNINKAVENSFNTIFK